MTVYLEPIGSQFLDLVRAPMHIEGLIAGAAKEVMVMGAFCELVTDSASREFDFCQPRIRGERLHVTIDRCEPERWNDLLTVLQDLFGSEGTTCAHEDTTHRTALTGVSLHRVGSGQWDKS